MTKRRPEVSPASNPGKPGHAGKTDHTLADAAAPVTPQGLKRRHFMGTALALDAAALLAACGGGAGAVTRAMRG